ncbi:ABC transporter substrate binding protein [Clostridium sp.]
MHNGYFKQKQIAVIISTLILLCLCLSNSVYAEGISEQKNVLIINSYHQGLTWSKDETNGIIDVLKQSNNNLSIYVEYMDWKNYPTDENKLHLFDYYKYKYQNKHIDVLIVTDDVALEFALKNRKSLFSNAPIVFCGVNQSGLDDIVRGQDNVTGVLEEVDPTNTMKMALQINPSLKTVYVLFDNSESGVSTGKLVIDKIKNVDMKLNIIPLNNLSYDELIKNVSNYKDDSIIIVTTYYGDINGKTADFENVSRILSKNSSVPVYHLYDFGLNNGAVGGSMISGKLQGMSAANLALQLLKGEDPDEIAVLPAKSTRNVLDFEQLKRFNIDLNRINKDWEIINKPFSFFDTYKTPVLIVLAIFILLIIFVYILLIYIGKIRKMDKKLLDNNEELTQVYEELEASDEELRQQYDEVVTIYEKIRIGEERLTYLAFHDMLTGLPNKLSLFENSNKNIFISSKNKAALLFLDIDNFKYINDTLGHDFGDKLIIKISERLVSRLKESYSIFRLSGDEFIIIIQNMESEGDVQIFASHIIDSFREEFHVIDSILHISVSIGVSICPDHGNDLKELLKYADIAMYSAKDAGRNRYVIYEKLMNEVLTERMNIEKYLRTALEKNELEIYYQPQFDLETKNITGFEALMRWKSPELGFISPVKFIKVAEDTRLIISLGSWILRGACAFLTKLHIKGNTSLTISVNVSIVQLLQIGFNDMVIDILEEFCLDPNYLELEITESILMESFEIIGAKLESLREMGVRIALDDFGTGYSSLSYLKQLPISTLKIDKSFIDEITCDGISETLTGQIIMLGSSMGMCVVAEGVESREQLEYLINHKCHKIQGYICSKPIPEGEIEKLLKINLFEELFKLGGESK